MIVTRIKDGEPEIVVRIEDTTGEGVGVAAGEESSIEGVIVIWINDGEPEIVVRIEDTIGVGAAGGEESGMEGVRVTGMIDGDPEIVVSTDDTIGEGVGVGVRGTGTGLDAGSVDTLCNCRDGKLIAGEVIGIGEDGSIVVGKDDEREVEEGKHPGGIGPSIT